MRFLGVPPSQALAFGAVIGALLVVLYLLKMRRRRVTVPFSPLWAKVLMQKDAASWLRRLKRLLSLLLQLLILAAVLVALTDPQPQEEVARGRSIALVIDTSASMSAIEPTQGDRQRMALALDSARALIDELSPQDKLMILAVDGQVRPLTGDFLSDKAALRAAIEGLTPSATEARLIDALSAAADALADRQDPSLVLISDAAHPAQPTLPPRLLPMNLRFRHEVVAALPDAPAVKGAPDAATLGNLSINTLNIRRYLSNKLDYELFIQVQNHFDRPVCAQVGLYNVVTSPDGGPDREQLISLDPPAADDPCKPARAGLLALSIPAKGFASRFYPRLPASSDRIAARASLDPASGLTDLLPMDDAAFVVVPQPSTLAVTAVTPGNLFLEAALLHNKNIKFSTMTPAEATPARLTALSADVVIFDNSSWDDTAPAPPKVGNYLYINPRGDASPFRVERAINAAIYIDRIDRKHPMSRWLNLRDVNISRGATLRPKNLRARNEILAQAPEGPIIVTSRDPNGSNFVALGFSLTDSDIVMRFALPLLLINALDWFSDDGGSLVQGFRTGQSWRIPLPPDLGAVDLRRPDGQVEPNIPAHNGELIYYGSLPGFYRFTPAASPSAPAPSSAPIYVAANFASWAESQLSPVSIYPPQEPPASADALPPPEALEGWDWVFERLRSFDVWTYCVLLALALLTAEWFTYHRRHTV
jgi:hypothetical protein